MFCINCGKELEGNENFCKYCGSKISVEENSKFEGNKTCEETVDNDACQQSIIEENTSGGTETNENTEISNMVSDSGKSVFNTVMKVVLGILAGLLIWLNLRNIGSWNGVADFVRGNCIMLCLGAFILYALEESSSSTRKVLVFNDAIYYGKFIHVKNYDELISALNSCACNNIRSVYYNENGTVCVQGKYDTYTLIITEDNILTIDKKKKSLRRKNAAEACNIMACLVKYLNPNAPINSHEIVKRNNWFSKSLTIYASIAIVLMLLCVVLALVPSNNEYIDCVRKAEFQNTGVCYEDAMERFFDETEWSYFESTDDKQVVQMDAVLNYAEEELLTTIQFVLDLDNGMFEVYAMKLNDIAVPTVMMNLFVYYIFDSYDDANIDYWSILYEMGLFADKEFSGLQEDAFNSLGEYIENNTSVQNENSDEKYEYYTLDDFIGQWADNYSQRCYAEIYKEGGKYIIEVRWSDSAYESYYWYFNAQPDEGGLLYTDGQCWLLTYMDDGNVIEEQLYETGEGYFYLSEGRMYWIDYNENAGEKLEFEKIE